MALFAPYSPFARRERACFSGELGEARDGFVPQPCRIRGDRGLARLLDSGQSSIQRGDQLLELTYELAVVTATGSFWAAEDRGAPRSRLLHTGRNASSC